VTPRLTVLVRSYNRLPALCELLERLLAQRHDSFEILVVEQSTEHPAAAAARLAELEGDDRVRLLRVPPQGGSRARNLGAAHARGAIVVCIDDDDLPIGEDFLTGIEAPFGEDPGCLGVTCRHVWDGEVIGPWYRWKARRRCMRLSWLLKVPWTYPRYDQPVRGVHYVHGTGGALRRAVLARVGGWDEDTPIEDETSLGIRIQRALGPGEHLAFDPRAVLLRRMDLPGGLAKRWVSPGRHYARFMTFVHRILGRYYPWRVRLLYPLYVLAAYRFTLTWLWEDSVAHRSLGKRLLGSLALTAALPWYALRMLREPLGRPPGSGLALRERLADRATPGRSP
jgi:glycosyltransferase involved in cell wall biosynthesis